MESNFKTIKRFDTASVCRLVFFIDLFFMSLLGIFMAILTAFVPMQGTTAPFWLTPLVLAIVHPIAATIGAALFCAIYNRAAGKFGGVRVEII